MINRRVKAVLADALPCAAMILVEGCIIALTISASTAMADGMSPFVFVVYSNALGFLLLLPYSYFYDRDHRSGESFLNPTLLMRVFLLGLVGVTVAQNLAFLGLSYSSPIVACGMANQIPALSFLLALILRTASFNWKQSSFQARVIGTLISFAGAISLTFYKGPTVKNHHSSSTSVHFRFMPSSMPAFVFSSKNENWVLGCLLFAAASLVLVIWNILQVGTLKMCPKVMKIICFYTMFGTIMSAFLALFLERDNPQAWSVTKFELLVIVLTAIFTSVIRSSVQIWCTRMKGPNFVAKFKPFGIPYASTFGSVFFADTFHYGSMLGALICGVGYYTVLWGQLKQEEMKQLSESSANTSSIDENKVPLLQGQDSRV